MRVNSSMHASHVRARSRDRYNNETISYVHVDPETGINRTYYDEGGRIDLDMSFAEFEHHYESERITSDHTHGVRNHKLFVQYDDGETKRHFNIRSVTFHHADDGVSDMCLGVSSHFGGLQPNLNSSDAVQQKHAIHHMHAHKDWVSSGGSFATMGEMKHTIGLVPAPCGPTFWAIVVLADVIILAVDPEAAAEEIDEQLEKGVQKALVTATGDQTHIPLTVGQAVKAMVHAIDTLLDVPTDVDLVLQSVVALLVSFVMNPMGAAKAELVKLGLVLTGVMCWPENFPEVDLLIQGLRAVFGSCQIRGRCTGQNVYDCPCE